MLRSISIASLFLCLIPVLCLAKAEQSTASYCANAEQAEIANQSITNKLSSIVAFSRDTNAYALLNTDHTQRNKSLEILSTYNDTFMYYLLTLSEDGQRLLAIYGGYYDEPITIKVVNLLTGTTQTFKPTEKFPRSDSAIVWADATHVVATEYDRNTQAFHALIIDVTTETQTTIFKQFTNEIPLPTETPLFLPNLSQVIYKGLTNLQEHLVVLNIEDLSYKMLNSAPFASPILNYYWSPRGDYVAVLSQPDNRNYPTKLQIVDQSAQIVLKDDLSPYTDIGPYRDERLIWSPQNDKFMVKNGEFRYVDRNFPITKVMSLNADKEVDLCIPGNKFWSPDGTLIASFLFAETTETTPGHITDVFVYDISTDKLYRIDASSFQSIGEIVGWGMLDQ